MGTGLYFGQLPASAIFAIMHLSITARQRLPGAVPPNHQNVEGISTAARLSFATRDEQTARARLHRAPGT